jgi:hypothetical protein
MVFAPRAARALKEIADQLLALTVASEIPISLEALRDHLRQCLTEITIQGEPPNVDDRRSAEEVIAEVAGAANVMRLADKVVVQTFLSQFPVEFSPEKNLLAAVEKLLLALRQIAKNEEVSARLGTVLDGIESGMEDLAFGPHHLFAAGDKAFASYKSLEEALQTEWSLAKDAYQLKAAFTKRRQFWELHQKILGANMPSYAASARNDLVSPGDPLLAPSDVGEQTTPEAVQPAEGEGSEPPAQDIVDELTAELEASVFNRPLRQR